MWTASAKGRKRVYCGGARRFLEPLNSVGIATTYGFGLHHPRLPPRTLGQQSSNERYWQSQYSPPLITAHQAAASAPAAGRQPAASVHAAVAGHVKTIFTGPSALVDAKVWHANEMKHWENITNAVKIEVAP